LSIIENSTLIDPYGGRLMDPLVPAEAFEEQKAYASRLPSLQISPQALADLELLASGALSPVDRFMGSADYQRVLEEMRLADGTLFPMPVTLAVEDSPDLHLDRDIALRNSENELLSIITATEIYPCDPDQYASQVLGNSSRHISGPLQILKIPRRYDFRDYRLTPIQARACLAEMAQPELGKVEIAAYHPPDTTAAIDEELLSAAAEDFNGILLLQLAHGAARPGDMTYYTRVSLYKALAEQCFDPLRILLSLLPLTNRGVGIRQTLWQALISRNYGASHLLTSHEQEGTTNSPRNSRDQLPALGGELGVMISAVPQAAQTRPSQAPPSNRPTTSACIRRTAAAVLAKSRPPRLQQGVCIWFTGLSGAGKSTTAEILTWQLMGRGRQVTVLDGDVVRTHLSKGLGFSKEDRDTNVRRIGFVAAELVRAGGVVVCAVVSPYRAARGDVRSMMEPGHFVEVFVDTPLDICETRDVKGMYARARRGELPGFTGIDDPYEAPEHPEIRLDTTGHTPEQNAGQIIAYLVEQGFIRGEAFKLPRSRRNGA